RRVSLLAWPDGDELRRSRAHEPDVGARDGGAAAATCIDAAREDRDAGRESNLISILAAVPQRLAARLTAARVEPRAREALTRRSLRVRRPVALPPRPRDAKRGALGGDGRKPGEPVGQHLRLRVDGPPLGGDAHRRDGAAVAGLSVPRDRERAVGGRRDGVELWSVVELDERGGRLVARARRGAGARGEQRAAVVPDEP